MTLVVFTADLSQENSACIITPKVRRNVLQGPVYRVPFRDLVKNNHRFGMCMCVKGALAASLPFLNAFFFLQCGIV